MKQLKLREDLPENFTITKQVPGVGMVMFNTEKVQPQDYHKWSKMGFADLFVEKVIDATVNFVVEKAEEVIENFIDNNSKPQIVKEGPAPVTNPKRKRTPKK